MSWSISVIGKPENVVTVPPHLIGLVKQNFGSAQYPAPLWTKLVAALIAVLCLSSVAGAQQLVSPTEYYSRVNPPPTDPRIVGMEARLAVLEEKVAASDAKLDAILAAVRAKAEPAKPSPVASLPLPKAVTVASVRAPLSHTHTCSQGHSWDHVANPTHTCPVCGEYVTRVDQPSRMVNVNVGVTAALVVATVSEVSGSYYSLTASSGACANGQCAAPSSGFARRGLFGWRR